MNRLPFKSFHSSHFNSNNINQWNFYLQNLQQYQYDPYTQQRFYPNENEYNEFNQYEEILTHEPERNEELSKEAIAIFKFSEAYAKRQKEEEEEINTERECMEKNKTNWILDEYSSFHDNGIEAPVTSLVILSKQFSDQNKDDQDNILTQEHLLNSAYLQTCHQQEKNSPLVMWPVLPLRL